MTTRLPYRKVEQENDMKIMGINDDVTTCEKCGRTDLKRTVVLQADDGGIMHYGTECAATATGRTESRLKTAAERAENARPDRMSDARKRDTVRGIAREMLRGRMTVAVRDRVRYILGAVLWKAYGDEITVRVEAVLAKHAK